MECSELSENCNKENQINTNGLVENQHRQQLGAKLQFCVDTTPSNAHQVDFEMYTKCNAI